jgi:hypothetical protein
MSAMMIIIIVAVEEECTREGAILSLQEERFGEDKVGMGMLTWEGAGTQDVCRILRVDPSAWGELFFSSK